jgi:hypothetical protein
VPSPRLIAALSAAALALGPAAAARASTDPTANRQLSSATQQACWKAPAGAACTADALGDINAAHAAEGVPSIALPGDWSTLTVAQQLLAVTDLERVSRGLTPVLGLSAGLDRDAATAAAADEDPHPSALFGDAWSANWSGGYGSALEADFAWMYDDGPGSYNLDCSSAGAPGCWGHRHDILSPFAAPIVMGAAAGTGQYGPSLTELLVGGDTRTGAGQPDAPLAPSWTAIAATLPPGSLPAASTPTSTTAIPATAVPASTTGRLRHRRHAHRRRHRTTRHRSHRSH